MLGRVKGIASSLWFIVHDFLSKEGGGGQLVIFHSVTGILIKDLGTEHYFLDGWMSFNAFNAC